MSKIRIAALAVVILVVGYFIMPKPVPKLEPAATLPPAAPVKTDRVSPINISDKDTYGKLMDNAGVSTATARSIYDTAKKIYDLAKIHAGHDLNLVYDKDTDNLKELRYQIDTENNLFVTLDGSDWKAEIKPIPYEVKTEVLRGEVKTSMYQAAIDNNIDPRAIIDLADIFQWTLDFSQDSRVGDKFSMLLEQRYLDGKYVMPGRILAGQYMNDGHLFEIYYSTHEDAYFDEKGKSTQRAFLKAPVAFKYITSGFTNGMRYVSAFNVATRHRAIDYAAPKGTPIRAVGDGIVTFAGWSTAGYGNLTSIRHNATYSTNYAHQSKILVRRGQHVKQGQIIGSVGTTGFSTGPHLHFEMVKNGVKINPLREVLPPSKSIPKDGLDKFLAEVKEYQEKLK